MNTKQQLQEKLDRFHRQPYLIQRFWAFSANIESILGDNRHILLMCSSIGAPILFVAMALSWTDPSFMGSLVKAIFAFDGALILMALGIEIGYRSAQRSVSSSESSAR